MDLTFLQSLVVHLNSKNDNARFLEKIDLVVRQSIQSEIAQSVNETFNKEEQTLLAQLNIQSKAELISLANELEQTPVMKIYTAITPSGNAEKILSELLRETTKETFFIEFAERPSLIAGAVIEYKGKIADFSLKNSIESIK